MNYTLYFILALTVIAIPILLKLKKNEIYGFLIASQAAAVVYAILILSQNFGQVWTGRLFPEESLILILIVMIYALFFTLLFCVPIYYLLVKFGLFKLKYVIPIASVVAVFFAGYGYAENTFEAISAAVSGLIGGALFYTMTKKVRGSKISGTP